MLQFNKLRISNIIKIYSFIEKKLIKISDEDFNVKEPFYLKIIKYFFLVLSIIYGSVVSLRLWLYSKNILKSRKAPCFVISIGNITAGGSGKTPMAVYLAELLKSMGFNTVVISRGYGGNLSKSSKSDTVAVVVGDGNSVFKSHEIVGDEPFMMASRLSFPVVVGKDRFKAAMMAVDLLNVDVIILDDGFQHIQLKRDLDILLMDYSRPLGSGYLLPAGRLREPPKKAVERADIVIFTRYPYDNLERFDKNHVEKIVRRKGGFKPFFITKHRPFLYTFLSQNRALPATLESLKGRNACLFSGIANNQSFRKTVEHLGISVNAHLEFNDHHIYKPEDILLIIETYYKCGADLLITTEKDYARLGCNIKVFESINSRSINCELIKVNVSDSVNFNNGFHIYFAVVGVEINFVDNESMFKEVIKNRLKNQKNSI